MRLFLLGIKHSGKSTFSRLLASRYGVPSVDSDDLVLERIKPSRIREYYAEYGKSKFQEIEYEAVRDYLEMHASTSFVFSLGGGVSDNAPLLKLLKENGTLIYLYRSESDILSVILKHGIPGFLDPRNIEESFHKIFKERDAIYKSVADKVITLGPYRDRMETLEYIDENLTEYVDAR